MFAGLAAKGSNIVWAPSRYPLHTQGTEDACPLAQATEGQCPWDDTNGLGYSSPSMTLYQYQAGVSLPKISLHSPLCLEGEVDQNQVQGYLMPDEYFLPISSLQAPVLRDSLVETTKLKIGGQEDRSGVQGTCCPA